MGVLLDSLSNAIDLISQYVTYLGTVFIIVVWCVAEYVLRKFNIRWRAKGGHEIRLQRLGASPRFALIGAMLLLWFPRALDLYKGHHVNSGQESVNSPVKSQPPRPIASEMPSPLPTASALPSPSPSALKPFRRRSNKENRQRQREIEALEDMHEPNL